MKNRKNEYSAQSTKSAISVTGIPTTENQIDKTERIREYYTYEEMMYCYNEIMKDFLPAYKALAK